MFDKRVKPLWEMNTSIVGQEVVFYGAGEEAHEMYRTHVRQGRFKLLGMYDNRFPGGGERFYLEMFHCLAERSLRI